MKASGTSDSTITAFCHNSGERPGSASTPFEFLALGFHHCHFDEKPPQSTHLQLETNYSLFLFMPVAAGLRADELISRR